MSINQKGQRGSQAELEQLMKQAQQSLPGVVDLLEVYGKQGETVRQVEAYMALLAPNFVMTTSNESRPPSYSQ